MKTFADWKKENIDWDASKLDSATKKLLIDHMESCWNDGRSAGLDMGLASQVKAFPGLDQFSDPKREELLRLAGELAVALESKETPTREVVQSMIPERAQQFRIVRAEHCVSAAAAIIAEVDRVSGVKP